MNERRCSTCRHWVEDPDWGYGGCHGPGASIYSERAKAWTTARAVFSRAAATVGLYQYSWSGRATLPMDTCENHQTAAEAAEAGVPIWERIPTSIRPGRSK